MLSVLPPPVQVRFSALYEPDMARLGESLIPFGRWSEEHVAANLPVVVSYPAEISGRLEVLKSYLTDGGWPPGVSWQASDAVRELLRMMPHEDAGIARGVRLVVAAAIRDDGSRAPDVRDKVLSIFLASKMLAVARVLKSCVLTGELPLEWGAEFYEMKTVWSSRLIFGLAFITHNYRAWAGWTDADLTLDAERYRLFIPICPALELERENELDEKFFFSREEILRIILPQLLGADSKSPSYLTIRRLAFEPHESLERNLILRHEVFVDAETCTDHPNAKEYVARIASDRIAFRLQQIPVNERMRSFILMTHQYPPSLGVATRVRKKVDFE